MTRLRIVVAGVVDGYEGMDRPLLGALGEVPEPLVIEGLEIEALAPRDAVRRFGELAAKLAAAGVRCHELLALDPSPGEPEWKVLGLDVGELGSRAWSAVRRLDDVLSAGEAPGWRARLNRHGLFERGADAEAFLARYLASPDEDRGWGPDGGSDDSSAYGVVAVSRFEL